MSPVTSAQFIHWFRQSAQGSQLVDPSVYGPQAGTRGPDGREGRWRNEVQTWWGWGQCAPLRNSEEDGRFGFNRNGLASRRV